MFATRQDDSDYSVTYRSYLLALALLPIPPILLYEHVPSLPDGSIDRSELAGLILGILLPLIGAYYLTEFASFTFSRDRDQFSWSWHNFIQKRSGRVPLQRVVKVSRQALDSSASPGRKHVYRLVVILDDDSVIPLTRGFSSLHDKKLEQIVDQIREHLGHFVAVR